MNQIDIIAGARPNFVKIASIVRAMELRQISGGKLNYRIIHTGQHYDSKLSDKFFEQLNIPSPNVNLGVGSGTQAEQVAAIMVGYEKLLFQLPPALCLVVGDVNSTVACAIAAKKLQIPVAHVEAGIRSGDLTMPEEINRIVTDSISDWFFTTSKFANANLEKSGVSKSQIFFVGNTMIDTLLANMKHFRKPIFFDDLELSNKRYFVMTLHRPSNVDNKYNFKFLLETIAGSCRNLPIIFPAHPRTAKILHEIEILPNNIHLVDPQPYLEFNYLVQHSMAVITDSGGITEETTVMGIPCMTLRDSTERPETVSVGTNQLLGGDPLALKSALDFLFMGKWKQGAIPEFWDGKAGDRIVHELERLLC